MKLDKSLSCRDIKYVLALALLTTMVYTTPAVKARISAVQAESTAVAAVTVSNSNPSKSVEIDTAACPVGYICTPNPKLTISSVQISGPNPQVISYRLSVSGVDKVEMNLSANGSSMLIPGFSAVVNGTRDNALGKTTLNTRGKTIYEWQVAYSNKTGKDILVGVKAIGYTGKKQVGADGDAITAWGNPVGPFCPFGYTCISTSSAPIIDKVSNPVTLGSKITIEGKNFIDKGGFVGVYIDNNPVSLVDGDKDGTVLFFTVPNVSVGPHTVFVKSLTGVVSNSVDFTVLASSSASCYQFYSNLDLGSVGADVIALQTLLISQGYNIPNISSGQISKGVFDVETKSAVMLYQTAHGMPSTGYVGSLTRASLNACPTTPVATSTCPVGYVCTY